MSVTVSKLLKLPSLRQAKVIGGTGGLQKVVSSISVLESTDPSVLINEVFPHDKYSGGEIVITGFLNCVNDIDLQCSNIRKLIDGGGSVILPEKINGAASVLKPKHFGCANAIGSAISKVSGTYEKLMNYDELPREQSLEKAKNEAIELAVEAGAVRETVEIIEMEDVPLAYYPGNTNRVKIKAAGDLS